MKNLQAFLPTLPNLVAGQTSLNAIFVSYNCVAGYEDGPVNTGKSGLNIVVQNGNLHYEPVFQAFLAGGLATGELSVAKAAADAMDGQARGALRDVQEKVGDQLTQFNLAVVYAGLSAFNESLDYARQIRKSNPEIKIVILTCDCDLIRKEVVLAKAVEVGEINEAVCTHECGGRAVMRDILNGLVVAWPN